MGGTYTVAPTHPIDKKKKHVFRDASNPVIPARSHGSESSTHPTVLRTGARESQRRAVPPIVTSTDFKYRGRLSWSQRGRDTRDEGLPNNTLISA